jgi:hypothetical protein
MTTSSLCVPRAGMAALVAGSLIGCRAILGFEDIHEREDGPLGF